LIIALLGLFGLYGSGPFRQTAVITANSSAAFIPANVPEYFAVTSGQVLNFLTTSTSTGYVCLTEMT
jgi:hypothetical protein